MMCPHPHAYDSHPDLTQERQAKGRLETICGSKETAGNARFLPSPQRLRKYMNKNSGWRQACDSVVDSVGDSIQVSERKQKNIFKLQ